LTTLDPVELDVLCEASHIEELPYPLQLRSHGATAQERVELRRQVRGEPRVLEWLEVLAAPALSIDSVYRPEAAAAPVRALAASGQGATILAVQQPDGTLELRPLDDGALISAVVDLLPPGLRGTELSTALPAEELAGSTRSSLRGGQLAANSRDQLSGRRRSPVLAWFDTPTGRYFGQVTKALDGREWTTVAPADAATLRKRLSEMMAGVTD
jgi:hypothetical protein